MRWIAVLAPLGLSGCAVSVSDNGVTGTVLFDESGPSGGSVGINL